MKVATRGSTRVSDLGNFLMSSHDLAFLHGAGPGAEMKLKGFRKDVILDVFNEAGQKAISYKIFRCWVSEYQATPEFDANANAVAIQTLKLECEGWERDDAVTEPTEQ